MISIYNTYFNVLLCIYCLSGYIDICLSIYWYKIFHQRQPYHDDPFIYLANNSSLHSLYKQNGADVNISDNWGVTPMHLAASSGQIDVIRYLVAAGAQLSFKNLVCLFSISCSAFNSAKFRYITKSSLFRQSNKLLYFGYGIMCKFLMVKKGQKVYIWNHTILSIATWTF
jgi:ankyrin repeat protein